MKHIKSSWIVPILFYLAPLLSYSQQTIFDAITHDGLQREYISYIPANYTGNMPVPLILNFHGFTLSATDQMNDCDFRPIADTAGFIVVHPQGTLYFGMSHWNVGGWVVGSTVDDLGFVESLIDSLSLDYNIDQSRIYSTGYSNGGFMSYLLACQLDNKFAAVASVAGSMSSQTYNSCNPQQPVPVLEIHGTADYTIPYNGSLWSEPIDTVINFWVGTNNCIPVPVITPIANIDTTDGSTVESFVYNSSTSNVNVEHMKVISGGHTWPGSWGNMDIDASIEIWNFFSKYDGNDIIIAVDESTKESNRLSPNIYPNPCSSSIYVDVDISEPEKYSITSSLGQTIESGWLTQKSNHLDISWLQPDIYIMIIGHGSYKVIKLQ